MNLCIFELSHDPTAMSPPLLRYLWQMIEEVPTNSLMRFDDSRLVSGLLVQLEQRVCLSEKEKKGLEKYLYSHLSLIRDIAESRRYNHYPLAVG